MQSNNLFNSHEINLEDGQSVLVTGTGKKHPFHGIYWYSYTMAQDPQTHLIIRDNIACLMSLSPAGMKLYFLILYLLNLTDGKTSEVELSPVTINTALSGSVEDENTIYDLTSSKKGMSRNTFYSALKELLRIEFIKKLKGSLYKVNSNYLFNAKDEDPERW